MEEKRVYDMETVKKENMESATKTPFNRLIQQADLYG